MRFPIKTTCSDCRVTVTLTDDVAKVKGHEAMSWYVPDGYDVETLIEWDCPACGYGDSYSHISA